MDQLEAYGESLQHQLDSLLATQFRRPKGEQSATDESGRVSVTVGPDGLPVKISVDPKWSDDIGDDELATTIHLTIGNAQMAAFGFDEEPEDLSPEEVAKAKQQVLAEAEKKILRPVSEDEHQAMVERLPSLFDQFDQALVQLDKRLNQMAGQAPEDPDEADGDPDDVGVEVKADNSMVSLVVNNGSVIGVNIHKNWLAGKSGHALTECFDQIIDQLPTAVASS